MPTTTNFSLPLTAATKLTMALCRPNKGFFGGLLIIVFLSLSFYTVKAGNTIVLLKGSIPTKLKEKMSPEDIVYWNAAILAQDQLLEKAINLVWGITVQSKEDNNNTFQTGEYYISTSVWTEQLKSGGSAKSFKKWIASANEPAKQLTAEYPLRSGKLMLRQKGSNGEAETIISIDLPSSLPDYEGFVFSAKTLKASLGEKLSGMTEKDRMRASMARAGKLKELELIIPEGLVLNTEVAEFSTVYKFRYKVVSGEEYQKSIVSMQDEKKAILIRVPVADGSFRFIVFDPFNGETLAQATRRPLEEYEEDYISYLLGKSQLSEISRYIE
jgi:hypothetical protein